MGGIGGLLSGIIDFASCFAVLNDCFFKNRYLFRGLLNNYGRIIDQDWIDFSGIKVENRGQLICSIL